MLVVGSNNPYEIEYETYTVRPREGGLLHLFYMSSTSSFYLHYLWVFGGMMEAALNDASIKSLLMNIRTQDGSDLLIHLGKKDLQEFNSESTITQRESVLERKHKNRNICYS